MKKTGGLVEELRALYYFNENNCPIGTFPCLNSTICKLQSSWCNGIDDCPYGDDETAELCVDLNGDWSWLKQDKLTEMQNDDCVIEDTPEGCIYNQCRATCKGYEKIPQNCHQKSTDCTIFFNIFIYYYASYLDYNDINEIEEEAFVNQKKIFVEFLKQHHFKLPRLPVLRNIKVTLQNVSENYFETITADMFDGVPALQSLNMELNWRIISFPHSNVFKTAINLTKLLIGYNPIEDFSTDVLDPLANLRSLGVEGIKMDNLDKDSFNVFTSLDFIYFEKFHYCMTYASKVQKCAPATDGLSSLTHLLSTSMLKGAVWGISCVTFIGNAFVLWERFTAKDENRVLSILIKNLAVSDMLMGVYLFIIALVDLQFRDNYNKEANSWMSSWACTFLGVLAMISSEVSVLILSFMSCERFVLIAAPLKGHHAMKPQTATASIMIIWIIGFILAVIPVIHWRNSTRFYGANGMCFPFHIVDPYSIGWQYSAFIFLGVNLLGLITIGYVYVGMFASIWRTRHATPLSAGDMEFALRFFLIVLTDATCWAPIIILKILAMMKYPVPAELHAWVVVFVLPVNSAVNPLLYTFTTPKFRERLICFKFLSKIRNYVSRKHSSQESQMSITLSSRNLMFSISSNKKNDPEKIPPLVIVEDDWNDDIMRRIVK
ncbi:LOW QUALITY PROTEIN: relaxin receptor 1-like [Polistes fuscatus]|uniref:LOW QUALITY PROTEIN: relaxin receptor 1-like n=1 Tax=Polistes fuscatus TaxID=30207 RepID=UPI001CAA3C7E|nr:LOW QUALITY PROTEIN: relaxin receptor 1-like [Polistes fuscatus]